MKEYQYMIRAHHGMCLAFFEGKGYSSDFSKHMGEVKSRMEENPYVCIMVGTDLICSACPNNRNEICISEKKVVEYDRQVLLRCNLAEGTVMPFAEFEELVYRHILRSGKRQEICGDCQWNDLCHFKKKKRKKE